MHVSTCRRIAVAAVAVAGLASAGACSATVNAPQTETVTLRVDIFGGAGFGYEDLYPEFERNNPNVKIVERGR